VLPLLPGYISFISGESIECLTGENCKGARLKALLGAVFLGSDLRLYLYPWVQLLQVLEGF